MPPVSDWNATSEDAARSLPWAILTGVLGTWGLAAISALLELPFHDGPASLPTWATLGHVLRWLALAGAVGGWLEWQGRRAPNAFAGRWLRLTGSFAILGAGLNVDSLHQFGPGPWALIATLTTLFCGTAGVILVRMWATLFPERTRRR